MTRPARRPGFTLIELMVAAALSLVIMTIMALAFQSGMGTLSSLKSMGDAAENLRTAEVLLRGDLDAEHAIIDDSGGALRAGELRYDSQIGLAPRGYFIVTSGSAWEGNDSEVPPIPSNVMSGPTANTISMTTRRTGRTAGDLYPKAAPSASTREGSDVFGNGVTTTQWAEVKWMLGAASTIGGVTMYPLHRVVKPWSPTAAQPSLPAAPTVAGGLQPAAAGTADYGADIVLTNVLSFEVKQLFVTANPAGAVPGVSTGPLPASDFTPVATTTNPVTLSFDTSKTNGNDSPYPYGADKTGRRCAALKVTIRVFDIKTKLARQVTLIVKM